MDRLNSGQQRFLDQAAGPTVTRIDADLVRVSWKCRPLLRHIRTHFLSEGYGAKRLKSAFPDKAAYVLEYFRSELGMAPTKYITAARIETAARLLRDTDLSIGEISLLAGYNDTPAFRDTFRRTVGILPSKFRRNVRKVIDEFGWPDEDPLELRIWNELEQRTLETSKRKQLSKWFRSLYDVEASKPKRSSTNLVISIFQILGKATLKEGRLDRKKGVELARLAIDFLDANSESLGEEACSARALGWARLANAYRLASNFPDAEAAFSRTAFCSSDTLFAQRAESEIFFLKSTFLQFQRRFSESREVLRQALAICRTIGDRHLLARLLIQLAKLDDYSDDHQAAIKNLKEALTLLSESSDRYISAVAYGNLATSYVWARKPTEALRVLPDAIIACEEIESPFNLYMLRWIAGIAEQLKGNVAEAEKLLRESRGGLIELGEVGYVGMINLELAILHQQQEYWAEAANLAAEALPALRAFKLPELLGALDVLSNSLASNALTLTALQTVREEFRSVYRDPTSPLTRKVACPGAG